MGPAILAASLLYLVLRKRINNSVNPSLPDNKILSLILNVIFFFTFSASLLVMHQSEHRPFLYFTLTSVGAAAIAAEILSSTDKPSKTWLLLLKILLISFSLRYGLLYDLGPGFVGSDPWTHATFVNEWVKSGHVSPATSIGFDGYGNYAGMHLNIMAMRIITGANTKDSFFLSIGLFYIASILFVFLIGRLIINSRAGLLAALFISLNPDHVYFGANIIPQTVGIGTLAILLWLIFKGGKNAANIALVLLMFLFIIFSHTLSAFVIGTTLFLWFFADLAYRRAAKIPDERTGPGIALMMLFWVAMLTWWMYIPYFAPVQNGGFFNTIFNWFAMHLKADAEFTGTAFPTGIPSAVSSVPLNRLWFLMLLVLIMLGSLYWLTRKEINNRKASIIFGTLGLATIMLVNPLFNIQDLWTERWLPFIFVVSAPIAAEGLMAISRIANGRLIKSAILVIAVFAFAMLAINTNMVNTYTPFYGKAYAHDPDRDMFNESELGAVDTITSAYRGRVTTDPNYARLPFMEVLGPQRVKWLTIGKQNSGLIVIREYVYTHSAVIGQLDDPSRAAFLNSFNGTGYNTVYNDGEVKAYLAENTARTQ